MHWSYHATPAVALQDPAGSTHHGVGEFLLVVDVLHCVGARLVEVEVVVWGRDPQVLPLLAARPLQELRAKGQRSQGGTTEQRERE